MSKDMDRDIEALEIFQRKIDTKEKIRLLEDLLLDLRNEEEAADQNMRPELHNRLAEGLRLTTNYLRILHSELENKKG